MPLLMSICLIFLCKIRTYKLFNNLGCIDTKPSAIADGFALGNPIAAPPIPA